MTSVVHKLRPRRTPGLQHVRQRRFGRGNHPAGLNFGDCFAYALSTIDNWPILCTGDDFEQTDAAVVQS